MAGSEKLVSLVYLSAAVCKFSPQDLVELLEKSRKNNVPLGVSGMLLFRDGNFLQVLEGEQKTVMALFKKIGNDSRHRKVVALSQEFVLQRDFPDWSMGFQDLSMAGEARPAGFTPFLDTSLTLANFASDPGRAKKLLMLFKEDKLLAKGSSAE